MTTEPIDLPEPEDDGDLDLVGTGNVDIDTLSSEPALMTLESGLKVHIERLRTRAMMSLLKILTRGASEVLPTLTFSEDTSPSDFTGQLVGAVVLAIPEAEDETIQFVNRMVTPADLVQGTRLSQADAESNAALIERLAEELYDPTLDDLANIVTRIIVIEGPHIQALGKSLGALIRAQQTSARAKQGASSKRSS